MRPRLQGQSVLAGQPRIPGAVHLFVAQGDMEWFGRNPMGSIRLSVSPTSGTRIVGELAPGCCCHYFDIGTELADGGLSE